MINIDWISLMFGIAIGTVCATLALVAAHVADEIRETKKHVNKESL